MADDKEIKEPKVNVGVDSGVVKQLLESVVPKSMRARTEQLMQEHENNLVFHEDTVAVYEVSDGTLARVDGTPGVYKIARTDPDNPIRAENPDAPLFTKQGLLIYDTYEVVCNLVAIDEWRHEYVLVPREEWEKHAGTVDGAMMSRSQQMASLMQRVGDSV